MSRHPYPLHPESTARRLPWAHLPARIRARIEERCGSPVVEAHSRDLGFTPAFASVLTCADGSRHFVKAASHLAQRSFAASYAEEVRHLTHLPPDVPAPALQWVEDDGEWIAFSTGYVEGRPVGRPWTRDDLESCLDALETIARAHTPAPAAMGLRPFVEETAGWSRVWAGLDVPSHPGRHTEAQALATAAGELLRGDSLVHADLRADNVLVTTDGTALFCDWNWPATGPPWLDSWMLLVGAYGDGVDVDAVVAERPLLREAPDEAVDSLLALSAGYFLRAGCESVPPNSPHVRDHQHWTGTVCWHWLAERRRW